jgi:hypothetical protein
LRALHDDEGADTAKGNVGGEPDADEEMRKR